jgi:hypothetical protein
MKSKNEQIAMAFSKLQIFLTTKTALVGYNDMKSTNAITT